MFIVLLTVMLCFDGSKRLGVQLADILGQSDEYREWSRQDPEFHSVKVSGEPAVATRGPGRNKVCVCPNKSGFANWA